MKSPLRPTGFILHETIMAMAMTMALVAGMAQLLAMVAQQRRLARHYAVAVQEAGNLMEELISRRWSETGARQLASVNLSEACSQSLPAAKLQVEVVDESEDVRRISVRIEWGGESGRRRQPVHLVGWKFRLEENGP